MRTIKRISYELNQGKYNQVVDSVNSYCLEKDKWLLYLQQLKNIHLTKSDKAIRNELVKKGYSSPFGLQARAWKLALKDACETMDKYWCSIFESIRGRISARFSNKNQQHYAYTLIKTGMSSTYDNLANLLHGKVVTLKGKSFEKLSNAEKREVVVYLMRKIKRARGKYPRVKINRSYVLDQDMYSIIEKVIDVNSTDVASNKRQFANISTKTKGKRIALPLIGCDGLGSKSHFGNIRIVLVQDSRRIELHRSVDLINHDDLPEDVETIGVDMGYTEVFATNKGEFLGEGFGDAVTKYSDKLKQLNQRRNKLRRLRDKALVEGKFKKAKNITKYNLGKKKYNQMKRKHEISLERTINQAINGLVVDGRANIVMEDLTHQFASNRGRNANRKMSAWVRGVIRERIDFKSEALGFGLKKVNSAYTSKSCPVCSSVKDGNRKGDKFKCLDCGYENQADVVGAINIRNRAFDEQIKLKMPTSKVKSILTERSKQYKEVFKENT